MVSMNSRNGSVVLVNASASEIRFSVKGLTPSFHARSKVGPMTKNVMNSERLIRKMLAGVL